MAGVKGKMRGHDIFPRPLTALTILTKNLEGLEFLQKRLDVLMPIR